MRTNRADEALRLHGFNGRRDQKRFDAHVRQTRERTRRIVRVQRGENQVTRERRADGDVRRFAVANFADHYDVRILTQNMAQTHCERQADVRTHGDLIDAFKFIFDRFFNGNNAFADRIDRG